MGLPTSNQDSSDAATPSTFPEFSFSVWALVLPAFAFLLFYPLLALQHPGSAVLDLAVATALTALLLPASLLFHELAHAFAASRLGLTVVSINVGFAGAAVVIDIPDDLSRSRHLVVTAAGPLSNFVLGGLFWLTALPFTGVFAQALGFAAAANLVLGASNLLPFYPLDGFRLLEVVSSTLRRLVAASTWGVSAIVVGLSFAGLMPDFSARVWLTLIAIAPLVTLPLRPFISRLEEKPTTDTATEGPAPAELSAPHDG